MKRKITVVMLILALLSLPVFSQADLGSIQKNAVKITDSLAKGLAFNSTIGLNWSDAYIGQLIKIPPHLGVGIVGGATSLKAEGVGAFLKEVGGVDLPAPLQNVLPVPSMLAELRLGGIGIPFDLGFKVGFLPKPLSDSLASSTGGLALDYLLIGGDFRYAILKQGVVLPNLSIGIGYNYMKGGLSKQLGSNISYSYAAGGDTYSIEATAPKIAVDWQTSVFDLKAQVSKTFFFVTPYLGIGANFALSKAGYAINSNVTYTKGGGSVVDAQEIKDALNAAGIAVPDLTSTGISYTNEIKPFGLRAFGGLSFNIFVVRIDITGMFNFLDQNYGGSVGLRVQL